jgi:hypothetical protein
MISGGFKSFAEELRHEAGRFGVVQSVDGRNVFWSNESGGYEAMFAYVIDPTNLDGIISTYQLIKAKRIPVTFAVIEQLEDGKGQYDIFRLSELSYLEHNNRAYAEGTSCDP